MQTNQPSDWVFDDGGLYDTIVSICNSAQSNDAMHRPLRVLLHAPSFHVHGAIVACTLSIPFGLLNVSLQLWMTMQMIQGQNMRQWLWATITQYLPFALIPQVLLLVVHQPF
jgi:hypothetical protein